MKIPMKVSKRTIGDPYELCLLKMFQNYQERGKRGWKSDLWLVNKNPNENEFECLLFVNAEMFLFWKLKHRGSESKYLRANAAIDMNNFLLFERSNMAVIFSNELYFIKNLSDKNHYS